MPKNTDLIRFLEPDIKALTLSYLRDKEVIDNNSIIINEFTVGGFSRRVDLVIFTKGKLIAFEIKSEADSLTRLNGQINTYLEYFDKVIVVADKKFTSKIQENSPKNVGLWEVSSTKIKIKNRGKTKKKVTNARLIDMMDVVDLSKLASKLKLRVDKQRSYLVKSLLSVSNKQLRLGVEAALTRKYKNASAAFLKTTKSRKILKEDLTVLSRFKLHRDYQKQKIKQNKIFWSNIDDHVTALTKFVSDHQQASQTNPPNPHPYQQVHHQQNRNRAAYEDVY